eukprot:jgi/Antlo1/92/884
MEGDAELDNVIEILRILFNTYEPLYAPKKYTGAHVYGGIAALFLSVADIFDGLAKDVDIMEGEVLFHEKLCGIRRQSRVSRRRKKRTPISLYGEKLCPNVSGKRLQDMWDAEPEDVKKRFRDAADAQDSDEAV